MTSGPAFDDYRNLSDAQWLRQRGLFVAEGRLIVRRVIEDARWRLHSLLLNDSSRDDLADVIDRVPASVSIAVRPTSEFEAITGFNLHRGCVALVHCPEPLPAGAVLETTGPILVLDGVANADNVGGVFRNAAAFGASGVLLGPTCCDPLYRKAVRTSMGAVLRVPFARLESFDHVRAAGFTLVALTPREGAESVDVFAARAGGRKIALVIGAEGEGLSQAIESAADVRVRIPMESGVDSLNLSVAAAIALYALRTR